VSAHPDQWQAVMQVEPTLPESTEVPDATDVRSHIVAAVSDQHEGDYRDEATGPNEAMAADLPRGDSAEPPATGSAKARLGAGRSAIWCSSTCMSTLTRTTLPSAIGKVLVRSSGAIAYICGWVFRSGGRADSRRGAARGCAGVLESEASPRVWATHRTPLRHGAGLGRRARSARRPTRARVRRQRAIRDSGRVSWAPRVQDFVRGRPREEFSPTAVARALGASAARSATRLSAWSRSATWCARRTHLDDSPPRRSASRRAHSLRDGGSGQPARTASLSVAPFVAGPTDCRCSHPPQH